MRLPATWRCSTSLACAELQAAVQMEDRQSLGAAMQSMQDLGQHDFTAQAVRIMDELNLNLPPGVCVQRCCLPLIVAWAMCFPAAQRLHPMSWQAVLRHPKRGQGS